MVSEFGIGPMIVKFLTIPMPRQSEYYIRTNWVSVLRNTHNQRQMFMGKRDIKRSMLYGVSPLTMELFPYNYRASTTIPWKTNKPITGFYTLVRMSNRFSYILLWVKPEEWVASLLHCGLQWVTAQNHISSKECTGTSASLQNLPSAGQWIS